MLRPDSSASNSNFFAWPFIEPLAGSLNLSAEVGIADGFLGDQIDAALEESLQ